MMKRLIVATIAAAALAAPAFAQSTTVTTSSGTTGVATGASLTIAPEQRTKIKQYVTTQKVKPVTVKEKISVGATLPADVELVAVPSDWGPDLAKYRYVYVEDDVVLVEPSSRRVIQVIE